MENKKPTLLEVKEYFKNAETAEDWSGTKNKVTLEKLEITEHGDVIQDTFGANWLVLFYAKKGYAKILTYKNTEPKFEITKEQIIILNTDGNKDVRKCMKEWFPEVFETVFKTGYYKHKNGRYPEWFSYIDNETQEYYGRGILGDWFQGNAEYHLKHITSNCEPMSTEEVAEALKNEAVKRGFIGNTYIDISSLGFVNNDLIKGNELSWDGRYLNYGEKKTAIFRDGIWAKTIPTKTIQEAEELLKELGHNFKIV